MMVLVLLLWLLGKLYISGWQSENPTAQSVVTYECYAIAKKGEGINVGCPNMTLDKSANDLCFEMQKVLRQPTSKDRMKKRRHVGLICYEVFPIWPDVLKMYSPYLPMGSYIVSVWRETSFFHKAKLNSSRVFSLPFEMNSMFQVTYFCFFFSFQI